MKKIIALLLTAMSCTGASITNYYWTNGTLTWADGESGEKYFDVVLVDNEDVSTNVTFTVVLSNLTAGAWGQYTQATVTILEDDGPNLEFVNQHTFFGGQLWTVRRDYVMTTNDPGGAPWELLGFRNLGKANCEVTNWLTYPFYSAPTNFTVTNGTTNWGIVLELNSYFTNAVGRYTNQLISLSSGGNLTNTFYGTIGPWPTNPPMTAFTNTFLEMVATGWAMDYGMIFTAGTYRDSMTDSPICEWQQDLEAGWWNFSAIVVATNDERDSFYFAVNDFPSDVRPPGTIWDIAHTTTGDMTGEERLVRRRDAAGTPYTYEFQATTNGRYTFFLRGREPYSYFSNFFGTKIRDNAVSPSGIKMTIGP